MTLPEAKVNLGARLTAACAKTVELFQGEPNEPEAMRQLAVLLALSRADGISEQYTVAMALLMLSAEYLRAIGMSPKSVHDVIDQ